jgi:Fe-S-cluster containining protein
MTKQPWYSDGLQFECTHCGDCCTGAPGFVWTNKEEITALAAAIREPDVDQFERLYVRKVGVRKSLKELPNGDCVFFDAQSRQCRAYEARPRQCRTWPFWSSNLNTPTSWLETGRACPGCNHGRVYSIGEIEELRGQVRV